MHLNYHFLYLYLNIKCFRKSPTDCDQVIIQGEEEHFFEQSNSLLSPFTVSTICKIECPAGRYIRYRGFIEITLGCRSNIKSTSIIRYRHFGHRKYHKTWSFTLGINYKIGRIKSYSWKPKQSYNSPHVKVFNTWVTY